MSGERRCSDPTIFGRGTTHNMFRESQHSGYARRAAATLLGRGSPPLRFFCRY
jgi:hypothetical protein